MPAILTHFQSAKESEPRELACFDAAFSLGAQGPDIFFFDGTVPWRKRKRGEAVRSFGSLLHHIDIAPLYSSLFEAAEHNKRERPLLEAYIYGLLLHYSVDRTCHPYVFYRSGVGEEPRMIPLYAASHCSFETMVDLRLSLSSHLFGNPKKALKIKRSELSAISLLWQKATALSPNGPYLNGEDAYQGARDYKAVISFVYSPSGFKKALLGKVLGKTSMPYCLSYPHNHEKYPELDFLNLQKKPWLDPVSGLAHSESFPELLKKAELDFLALYSSLKGKDLAKKRALLTKFVAGIDHDGEPIGAKKSHFDVIWGERK